MPTLRNSKHERFSQALAIGCSQSEAGRRAGFVSATSNKSYLSKLAQRVASRVAEIRRDNVIQSGAEKMAPNTSGKSLSELFPTSWIAEQYQKIQNKALSVGDMRTATESVKNLQKMVEKETAQAEGGAPKTSGPAPTISMDNVIKLLDKMGEIAAPSVQLINDQKHTAEDPPEVSKMARNRAHRAAARDE